MAENYTLLLKEPNERTISISIPSTDTLVSLENLIDETTRNSEDWPHFQRDNFMILVRGVIINEQYTTNVKLLDIQGTGLSFENRIF